MKITNCCSHCALRESVTKRLVTGMGTSPIRFHSALSLPSCTACHSISSLLPVVCVSMGLQVCKCKDGVWLPSFNTLAGTELVLRKYLLNKYISFYSLIRNYEY